MSIMLHMKLKLQPICSVQRLESCESASLAPSVGKEQYILHFALIKQTCSALFTGALFHVSANRVVSPCFQT